MANAQKESDFPAGKYVLTVDHYEQREYTDDRLREVRSTTLFTKGDEVELDEAEALRLGRSGSIAPEDTLKAKVAKGEVDPSFEPPATASVDSLEAQKEALEQAIRDRKQKEEDADKARDEVRVTDDASVTPVPSSQLTDSDAASEASDEDADEGGGVPKKRGGGRGGKANS